MLAANIKGLRSLTTCLFDTLFRINVPLKQFVLLENLGEEDWFD
jgi:hypothetical protein